MFMACYSDDLFTSCKSREQVAEALDAGKISRDLAARSLFLYQYLDLSEEDLPKDVEGPAQEYDFLADKVIFRNADFSACTTRAQVDAKLDDLRIRGLKERVIFLYNGMDVTGVYACESGQQAALTAEERMQQEYDFATEHLLFLNRLSPKDAVAEEAAV